MWNWLVSGLAAGATLLLYDGSPFHPGEQALFDFADAEAMTVFGTSAKYIDAVKKTGWRPAGHARGSQPFAPCAPPVRRSLPRASTSCTRQSSATCIWRRFPAAPTSAAASSPAIPLHPCGVARSRRPRWGLPSTSSTTMAGRCGMARASSCAPTPFPSMPVGFLERPRWAQISRCLLLPLRWRLASWRFCRMDRTRRHDHPRPFRRHAQSRRRPDRHGRNLRPGRADTRGGGSARRGAGLGGRCAHRAVRAPAAGGGAR